MVINHIEKMDNYTKFLRSHPNELEALFNDMLIGVTSFFREPETFVALKETVFPSLSKIASPKSLFGFGFPPAQLEKKLIRSLLQFRNISKNTP